MKQRLITPTLAVLAALAWGCHSSSTDPLAQLPPVVDSLRRSWVSAPQTDKGRNRVPAILRDLKTLDAPSVASTRGWMFNSLKDGVEPCDPFVVDLYNSLLIHSVRNEDAASITELLERLPQNVLGGEAVEVILVVYSPTHSRVADSLSLLCDAYVRSTCVPARSRLRAAVKRALWASPVPHFADGDRYLESCRDWLRLNAEHLILNPHYERAVDGDSELVCKIAIVLSRFEESSEPIDARQAR